MKIEKGSVVLMDYTLTDKDKNVLDSSDGHGPLAYLHGHGNIIPGLEKHLEGKGVGDSLQVTVPPEEGYGQQTDELIQHVTREQLQGAPNLEVGMQFQAQTPNGMMLFSITEINGDDITIDGNHPLAGMDLNFDVKVVEIRPATEEELQHGHVHGAGGHDH
ncbi:MAG: peptidylprolyl isomerase [Chrysiogenetes bacterium]|nr:peptidylprolyl isomerase [Chrysiogenetes bacterium]